ncbi:unnamed protein product [Diatraea saccharalis]|uniref:Uncharacterized protein n=1 Tax=Diatraea saccharalis TaxID=40085 RepID=A0A9N9R9W6_9NEOP|nr:unnamed protein product [Diatraea saccharalis]
MSNVLCKNKIVFILQIPLVNNEEYKLFQASALPVLHKVKDLNSFSLIIPNSKYIILSKNNTKYMNLQNLNLCNKLYFSHFICQILNTYVSDVKPCCESNLLTKLVNKIPSKCKTKFIIRKLDAWQAIFIQSGSVKLILD